MIDAEINDIFRPYNFPFTANEFGEGRFHLKHHALSTLARWRLWHGFLVQITDDYRQTGSHKYGTAFDLIIWKEWQKTQPDPMHIWRLATVWSDAGTRGNFWTGRGMYFDWEFNKKPVIGIHLDKCTQQQRPSRPNRWIRIDGVYYNEDLKTGLFVSDDGDSRNLEAVCRKWKNSN